MATAPFALPAFSHSLKEVEQNLYEKEKYYQPVDVEAPESAACSSQQLREAAVEHQHADEGHCPRWSLRRWGVAPRRPVKSSAYPRGGGTRPMAAVPRCRTG